MPEKKLSNVASHPVKVKSVRQATKPQKARKSPPTAIQAQVALDTPVNQSQVIKCILNPYLLTQFLFGYYGRGLSDGDAVFDASIISNLVYTTLNLFNNNDIQALGVGSMPREIVDLYYSLRTTQYKGVTYYCDLTFLSQFVGRISQGWTTGLGLLDVTTPNAADTNNPGFYICGTVPTTMSAACIRDIFAQYGSSFKMVQVTDSSRASVEVFSFDVNTPVSLTDMTNNAVTPFALAGYNVNQTAVYIKQNSFVSLEFQIAKPTWMFFLRLCTIPSYVKGFAASGNDASRLPKHGHPVNAFPSVIGHQVGSSKGEYRGSVQLKLCPLISSLSNIVARLEAAVVASGKQSSWTAKFTSQEVVLLAYGLWRAANSRYGAASYGVVAYINSSFATLETMHDSSGYKVFQTARIPQVINDCLQSQKVYSDKNGVLIPCYVRYGTLSAIQTTLSYTGTGITSIPNDSANSSYRYFSSAMSILAKYKPFEYILAGVCKITPVTAFGNSLLDCTISRDQYGNEATLANAILVSSRRPLTTQFLMTVLLKTAFVGYDYVPANILQVSSTTTFIYGGEDRNKVFSQGYAAPLSGTDTITNLINMSINDGFVPLGAEAGNAPDDTYFAPSPLEAPPSSSYTGLGYKLMSNVPGLNMIKYGNYGGPGWTAGSRDSAQWKSKNGKYLVEPVDGEDALYKKHDEGILRASGNYDKELQADADLYLDLLSYSKTTPLSTFGTIAKQYFSPVKPRDKSEL